MASAHVYIEVEPGPVMRAGLDVVEFAVELLEAIPEWHADERRELESRCQTLGDTLRMTAQPVEQEGTCLSEGTT